MKIYFNVHRLTISQKKEYLNLTGQNTVAISEIVGSKCVKHSASINNLAVGLEPIWRVIVLKSSFIESSTDSNVLSSCILY